jgi:hypothetical protein
MTNAPIQPSRDWLCSVRTSLLAWWMPKAAILGGLLVPVHSPEARSTSLKPFDAGSLTAIAPAGCFYGVSGPFALAHSEFWFDQNPRTFELGRQVGSKRGQDLNL